MSSTGLPFTQIAGSSWLDSAMLASTLPTPTGADDWEKQWSVYQAMRQSKLTVATFEEYLAFSGVEAPPVLRETIQDFRKPELVRFQRDFQYPVSSVTPGSGMVGSQI